MSLQLNNIIFNSSQAIITEGYNVNIDKVSMLGEQFNLSSFVNKINLPKEVVAVVKILGSNYVKYIN